MISKQEYENAFNICLLYQKQLQDEISTVIKANNNLKLSRQNKLKIDFGITENSGIINLMSIVSKKAYRAIELYGENQNLEIKKIGDLTKIDPEKLKWQRYVGKKTFTEIYSIIETFNL